MPRLERRNGVQTRIKMITRKIREFGMRSKTRCVSRSPYQPGTKPPGFGRKNRAIPLYMDDVASVTIMGCKRPYTTINPLIRPQSAPTSSTRITTTTTLGTLSANSAEANEFARLIIGPMDKSIPPVITTEVCAVPAKMSVIAWLDVDVVTDGSKNRGFRMAFSVASTRNTDKASKTRKFRLRNRLTGSPDLEVSDALIDVIKLSPDSAVWLTGANVLFRGAVLAIATQAESR